MFCGRAPEFMPWCEQNQTSSSPWGPENHTYPIMTLAFVLWTLRFLSRLEIVPDIMNFELWIMNYESLNWSTAFRGFICRLVNLWPTHPSPSKMFFLYPVFSASCFLCATFTTSGCLRPGRAAAIKSKIIWFLPKMLTLIHVPCSTVNKIRVYRIYCKSLHSVCIYISHNIPPFS